MNGHLIFSCKFIHRKESLIIKVTAIIARRQRNKVKAQFLNTRQLLRYLLRIIPWDERLSTVAAERILLEGDLSRAKRRKVIDRLSAAIILQGYLDSRPRNRG